MTKDEIMALEPGRDTDSMVAKKIMGKELHEEVKHHYYLRPMNSICPVPEYSTDMTVAWQIVDELLDNSGIDLEIKVCMDRRYYVKLFDDGVLKVAISDNSAPMAICKAALIVVCGEE